MQETKELYQFGVFRLDAAERRLWCEDEPIQLTPKQFDLLFYFVENAGRTAKKSELLDAVWVDTYIEETTLARNVSWLRKTLGEFEDGEPLIETVPKLGYRFTAEVTRSPDDENALIVEEQSIHHIRGEETIEFADAFAERRGKSEKKRKEERELSKISPSSRHLVTPSSLLIFSLSLIALAGIGFIVYQNYFKSDAQDYFKADTRATGLNVSSNVAVKNVTVDADRGIVDTGIAVQPGDIIDISADGKYQPGTGQTLSYEGDKTAKPLPDHTFSNADPWSLVGWVGTQTNKNDYFQVSRNNPVTAERSGTLYFALNNRKQKHPDTRGGFVIGVTLTRAAVSERPQIKIGSIVNLKNQYSSDAGYLDAWGEVKNKPEFSIVPTELMFVSTHESPNREDGSGSWQIVSATGKKDGETLVYGDKIHLKNMYPDAGYLDNCGWLKDMPVFKDFVKAEKFAVFTTHSEDRDNGTGTWIVSSNTKFDGGPVHEGESISLENGFPGGGFLNTNGRVNSIPAFSDYDGSLLVFIHESSTNRRPNSGIWTISDSKAALK